MPPNERLQSVRNLKKIAGAIQAHFDRLQTYHKKLLKLAVDIGADPAEA